MSAIVWEMGGFISADATKTVLVGQMIENGRLEEALARAFANRHARSVLLCLDEKIEKTAGEISKTTNISIATVYRKLNKLVDSRLAKARFEISEDGKRHGSYIRNFSEATMEMDHQRLRITLRKSQAAV